MKNLHKYYWEVREELEAIGIELGYVVNIEPNSRAKSRWGQCKIVWNDYLWENTEYSINISTRLLQDGVSDEALKNTIAHELLHTCRDCFNHGKEWKALAELVNDCYSFYNIKRCTSSEEKGIKTNIEQVEYKYIFRCEDCGQTIKRQRESQFVKYYDLYRCGRCKGNFKKVS